MSLQNYIKKTLAKGSQDLEIKQRLIICRESPVRLFLALLVICFITSCTFLSDKQYVQQNPQYRGVRRIAVFLQRWPVYLKLSGQNDLDADFIKKTTQFLGPWEPAGNRNPRALDVQDIDERLMAEVLLDALEKKGYHPFMAQALLAGDSASVATMMAQYQALDSGVDAFLFCFYAPSLFLSHPLTGGSAPTNKAYSLREIVQLVNPGGEGVMWAGPRAAMAPENSISHAFIYLSLTMFKARDGKPLWQVASAQTGGKTRPWVPLCPPGPTDKDYWADPRIIQNLMVDNLRCRLRHVLPNAF